MEVNPSRRLSALQLPADDGARRIETNVRQESHGQRPLTRLSSGVEAGRHRPLVRLLQLIDQEIQALLMVGGEGLKFDADALSSAPPNVRRLNRNGQVVSREEQEVDHHIGNNPNGILNSTALAGKVDGSGDVRSIMRQ